MRIRMRMRMTIRMRMRIRIRMRMRMRMRMMMLPHFFIRQSHMCFLIAARTVLAEIGHFGMLSRLALSMLHIYEGKM
jgi:hypothetical protein